MVTPPTEADPPDATMHWDPDANELFLDACRFVTRPGADDPHDPDAFRDFVASIRNAAERVAQDAGASTVSLPHFLTASYGLVGANDSVDEEAVAAATAYYADYKLQLDLLGHQIDAARTEYVEVAARLSSDLALARKDGTLSTEDIARIAGGEIAPKMPLMLIALRDSDHPTALVTINFLPERENDVTPLVDVLLAHLNRPATEWTDDFPIPRFTKHVPAPPPTEDPS